MCNGMKYIRKNNANILVKQGFMLLESVMAIVIVTCIMTALFMQHSHAVVRARQAARSLDLFWASQAFLAGEQLSEYIIVESTVFPQLSLPGELLSAGIMNPDHLPAPRLITLRCAHVPEQNMRFIDWDHHDT